MTSIDAPVRLLPALEDLRPELERTGVQELRVFSYRRPGERAYWLAFAQVAGARNVLGTPEFRSFSLARQTPRLVGKLRHWLAQGVPNARRDGEFASAILVEE
jgi:hypothetical protein